MNIHPVVQEIKKLAVQYEIIDLDGNRTRLTPSFATVLKSNIKKYSPKEALLHSINSYTSGASIVERGMIGTYLIWILHEIAPQYADACSADLNPVLMNMGKKMLESKGISTLDDVAAFIKADKEGI